MVQKITKKELEQQVADQNAEIARLRDQNAELENLERMNTNVPIDKNMIGTSAASYLDQVNSIMQSARVDTNKIQVKEFTDHKNISLWTKLGKRIGPLHQMNALRTLRVFYAAGVLLSTNQPTPAEIEAYKLTPEYAAEKKKLDASRAIKEKSRKKGTMDALAAEIAKISGQTVAAINSVLESSNVKTLKDGQSAAGVEVKA